MKPSFIYTFTVKCSRKVYICIGHNWQFVSWCKNLSHLLNTQCTTNNGEVKNTNIEKNNVTWRLKAGIATKRSASPFARQRFGKHIYKFRQSAVGAPLLSSSHSSLDVPQPFSRIRGMKNGYTKWNPFRRWFLYGSPEFIKGAQFGRRIRPGPPDWGSLKSETVKCIVYCTLYIIKDRPVLSSERAPHLKNPQCSDNNKNLVISPRWGLDTKKDWPTDRRS
jgi:hypothetical protein